MHFESIKEIEQNVHEITFKKNRSKNKIYLIGTAHVSNESVNLVEKIIDKYSPDKIFLELDEKRKKNLTNKDYRNLDIFTIIKKKQIFFYIAYLVMSIYQRKIAEKTGSTPGGEFKKAIEKAPKNSKIICCDREAGISMKRLWRKLSFWQKFKLPFLSDPSLDSKKNTNEMIEEMKKNENLSEMLLNLSKQLPMLKRVLIDERNEYMVKNILENLGKVNVVVIGAGHAEGMLQLFQKTEESKKVDLKQLEEIPKGGIFGKLLPYLIPLIFLSGFVWAGYKGDFIQMKESILQWIIINGSLSAIGCAIAFAHPLTIILSFLAAPITSLNPMIGVSMVTAFVQAKFNPPTIKDIEEIQFKITKIKSLWKNKLGRVFIASFLSALGSSIGTFWGGKYIIDLF